MAVRDNRYYLLATSVLERCNDRNRARVSKLTQAGHFASDDTAAGAEMRSLLVDSMGMETELRAREENAEPRW